MQSVPNFQIVPGQAELDSLARDLRFHPCGVEAPKVLSHAQIESFNRDGYLKSVRVFSEPEILGIRAYFDDLLARVIAAGGDSYSISSAHLRHGEVYDLLTHPRIVALVKDLLGENLIGWGAHFFCKMPGDGKAVAWQKDASYWPLTPSKTVTAWLAIDDAEVETACMRFIAGSHWHGQLTYRPSRPEDHNVLTQTIEKVERFGTAVDDDLRAGEISLHSDLLLHGSAANESTRRRCGLTLRYCAVDVRAAMGWNAKGVVVSGEDRSGHWARAC